MSYISQGQKGVELANNKQFATAIGPLSAAIKESKSPVWLLARAQAYQQTGKYAKALYDAERAYLAAAQRNQPTSLAQMVTAQYRRAVILYKLKRYADSDACCIWSMRLLEGKSLRTGEDDVSKNVDADGDYLATTEDAVASAQLPDALRQAGMAPDSPKRDVISSWSRAAVWRNQVMAAMAELPKGDPGRKITVSRVPDVPMGPELDSDDNDDGSGSGSPKTQKSLPAGPQTKTSTGTNSTSPPPARDWAKEKLRIDFYQSDSNVNLVIYVKNVDKDKLKIHFDTRTISIENMSQTHTGSQTTVLELVGSIDTTKPPTIRVTPLKVELTVGKAEPGSKWATWGHQKQQLSADDEAKTVPHAPSGVSDKSPVPVASSSDSPQTAASGTSRIHDGADGDTYTPNKAAKTAQGATASASTAATAAPAAALAYPTSSKTGPKDWDKVGSEANEDDKDANDFFKQLYSSGTPEQQRAMMKSYVESNGTALSTNWDDVKNGPVATVPPKGVEAKKW